MAPFATANTFFGPKPDEPIKFCPHFQYRANDENASGKNKEVFLNVWKHAKVGGKYHEKLNNEDRVKVCEGFFDCVMDRNDGLPDVLRTEGSTLAAETRAECDAIGKKSGNIGTFASKLNIWNTNLIIEYENTKGRKSTGNATGNVKAGASSKTPGNAPGNVPNGPMPFRGATSQPKPEDTTFGDLPKQ